MCHSPWCLSCNDSINQRAYVAQTTCSTEAQHQFLQACHRAESPHLWVHIHINHALKGMNETMHYYMLP